MLLSFLKSLCRGKSYLENYLHPYDMPIKIFMGCSEIVFHAEME